MRPVCLKKIPELETSTPRSEQRSSFETITNTAQYNFEPNVLDVK